jgi:hypothetical protein
MLLRSFARRVSFTRVGLSGVSNKSAQRLAVDSLLPPHSVKQPHALKKLLVSLNANGVERLGHQVQA